MTSPRWSLLLIVALTPSVAHADGPTRPLSEALAPEARSAYETGVVLYRQKEYAAALAQFRVAYKADGDPRLLWNMAVCEKNLARYAKALDLTKRYLAEGASALRDEERREAAAFATSLRGFVAVATVETTPPGATVVVDDEERGRAPLTLTLDAGTRTFRVALVGSKEALRVEQLEGASETVIRFTLEPADARVTIAARASNAVAIDGALVGRTPWTGSVGPGNHTFVVSASEHRPRTFTLTLAPGEARTLDGELDGELDPERRASPWPWVAGGAAVAGALAVGAYFLFRPSDPAAPPAGSLGAHTLQ